MTITIQKLKKRKEYQAVSFEKNFSKLNCVMIQLLKTPESNQNKDSKIKLGYTASKKVGSAVQRNKAKRRLKAASEELFIKKPHQAFLNFQGSIVFVALPTTVDCLFDDLKSDMIKGFHKCLRRLEYPHQKRTHKTEHTKQNLPR